MSGGLSAPATSQVKVFTVSLAQSAGTYDVFSASGGDVFIKRIVPYVDSAAAGLTSITLQTDDTTSVAILSSTLLAALTAGKNLTPFTTPTLLKSGKKGQITIVGIGSAGSLKVAVEFYKSNGDLV